MPSAATTRYIATCLYLASVVLSACGLPAHAQTSKVYSSFPFDLELDDSRPVPFQFNADYCTGFNLCGSGTGYWPGMVGIGGLYVPLPPWQGVPYRVENRLLDGSVTTSHGTVYRAGTLLLRRRGDRPDDDGLPTLQRYIIVPLP